jgi:polysaccharide export outer membrane protein
MISRSKAQSDRERPSIVRHTVDLRYKAGVKAVWHAEGGLLLQLGRSISAASHSALCGIALSSCIALVGCSSLEPGMRLGDTAAGAREQQSPVIRLISPELIVEENAARARATAPELQQLLGNAEPYVIGNGDLLSILVWNHPELNIAAAGAQALSSSSNQGLTLNGAQTPSAYGVDQNGQIQFPYAGPVKISGLTELQARNLLAEKLAASIKRPDITLRVLQFRSKKIYVDGEVRNPGNQTVDDVPMSLIEALTRAGGMLPSADESAIVISRKGTSYLINLPMVVRYAINPSDILLHEGDVVRVPSRDENKVYVLGEVTTPKALQMVNGQLTLTQALGEAGGLNPLSAAGKQVYVVRNAAAATPIVYNLNASSPAAMALADNFALQPHDVVFVDAAGLVRFNRVMNLIIPLAASAASSYYFINPQPLR